jgi:glutathionylspermidine synthase
VARHRRRRPLVADDERLDLLAINAQLPGSGLEAEAGQWSWLEEQLSAPGNNGHIALLTHKPEHPNRCWLSRMASPR